MTVTFVPQFINSQVKVSSWLDKERSSGLRIPAKSCLASKDRHL